MKWINSCKEEIQMENKILGKVSDIPSHAEDAVGLDLLCESDHGIQNEDPQENSVCGQDVGKETSYTEYTLVQPLRKSPWGFSKHKNRTSMILSYHILVYIHKPTESTHHQILEHPCLLLRYPQRSGINSHPELLWDVSAYTQWDFSQPLAKMVFFSLSGNSRNFGKWMDLEMMKLSTTAQ